MNAELQYHDWVPREEAWVEVPNPEETLNNKKHQVSDWSQWQRLLVISDSKIFVQSLQIGSAAPCIMQRC